MSIFTEDQYRTVIQKLGEAPDGQLATSLSKLCREFGEDEHTTKESVNFLRDIRDMAVNCGGASGFVGGIFSIFIPETESKKESKKRREGLYSRYGIECDL